MQTLQKRRQKDTNYTVTYTAQIQDKALTKWCRATNYY